MSVALKSPIRRARRARPIPKVVSPYTVRTAKDRITITVKKAGMDIPALLSLVKYLEVEALAKRVRFGKGIVALGETIKADWWAKHGRKYLRGEES